MDDFFRNLDPDSALEAGQLARLAYELREHRRVVLQAHDAADEAVLLERIRAGAVDEHPGYESYLAARILDDTHAAARAALAACLGRVNRS